MKQLLKQITALLTCAAMLSSAAVMQANAWELRNTGSVIPEETWDDHGMIRDRFCMERPDEYYVPVSHCRNDELGDDETPTYEEVYLALIRPRKNSLTFTFRADPDPDGNVERALTLIGQYYPDVVLSRDAENPVRLQQEWDARLQLTRTFSLVVDTETAGSAEIADALMHDLAAEG